MADETCTAASQGNGNSSSLNLALAARVAQKASNRVFSVCASRTFREITCKSLKHMLVLGLCWRWLDRRIYQVSSAGNFLLQK